MSARPPESPSTARRIALPSPFRLTMGGELVGAEVAVETYGILNAARDNAILVFTGLSASAHAAAHPQDPTKGWWEPMVGSGRALDTDRYCVVVVNSLGSCFGSTGPASVNPLTGQVYGGDFPEMRVEDIARASQAAVDALGIDTLLAAVGCSLGGMTVLAHAALFPGRARGLVSISGAMAANAAAIATRSLQREMVGTLLKAGADRSLVEQAMRWARKIGVLSYVGTDLLEQRFGRDQTEPYAGRGSGTDFEVESWLEHLAQKFVRQFDPWSYWTISRAMDLFDFGAFGVAAGADGLRRRGATDTAAAARKLHLERALVIGVRDDLLFPVDQQREMGQVLGEAGVDCEYVELSSPYGHDAFLTEAALFTPILTDFFAELSAPAARRSLAHTPRQLDA